MAVFCKAYQFKIERLTFDFLVLFVLLLRLPVFFALSVPLLPAFLGGRRRGAIVLTPKSDKTEGSIP